MKRSALLGLALLFVLGIISFVLAAPSVTVNSPDNGTFYEPLQTITVNYNVSESVDNESLNCSLIIDGLVEDSHLVPNATFDTFVFSKSQPETYDWYINCVNTTNSGYNTTNRTFIIDLNDSPDVEIPQATNTSVLTLVGATEKPGTVNLTIANDDYPSQRTNTTTTYSADYTHYLGSLSVTQIYNDSFFRVEDNLGGNLTSGNYLNFNHDLDNFTYYAIMTVLPVLDYFQINISPNMNQSVQVGEEINVYDADRPTGWFNISIELYPGLNNASIYGTTLGIDGEAYSESVYYDAQAPWFNTSNISGLQATNEINFSLYDDYNVSLETLYVNITVSDDPNNFTIYALNYTTYNASNITGNITCADISITEKDCTFNHSLTDGDYNITFVVSDVFGLQNSTTISGYEILSSVEGVQAIQDLGTTLSNLSLFVNWTNTTNAYIDYYELSVGNISGEGNVVAWFSVDANETNYTVTHENLTYMDWYFVNIRVVDILGRYSNTTSTDGITIEDNTPPINDFVMIIADSQGQWVNRNDQIGVSWNFTDNETPIDSYEYAIGTQPYPLSGWDDTVGITTTQQTIFNKTGLTLIENETYYVSVKARNSNFFGGNRWSAWYSSVGVQVDTQSPANGYLSYSGGATYLNSIDLNYLVGNDSFSGIQKATIYSSKATLTNGVCNGFSSDPARTINVSIIGSMTPQLYTYNNLDNGYCYRFELEVYDNAGNAVTYGIGGQTITTSVDTTPPSVVTITDEGYFTASSNLYFYWDTAVDAESGVSHYDYALGTAPGLNDVITWSNHSLTTTLNLASPDYNPGHLDDEEIYYLTVRAWNAHNASLYSQSSSDGILYFDFEAPSAMTTISVADDNTSGGWYDNTSEENISVVVYGESGLSCVWSHFDIDYIDDTADYATSCGEVFGNDGYYNCSLTNITQGTYTISVACQDAAGNKQTSSSNTDITFHKDSELPIINITSPNETIIPADIVTFIATINETSPYNITSKLFNATDDTQVWSYNHGISTLDEFSSQLDFTYLSGEFNYYYVLVDVFNNTVNDSVYVIVNHDQPLATLNFSDEYITNTQDVHIRAYLFNNITYSIYNGSGTQETYSETNVVLQNKSEYNLTIDTTTLSDGEYTILIDLISENGTYQLYHAFTIDTVYPFYATNSFEESPSGTIYEDDNITLNLVWNTQPSDTTMYLEHNASGTFENESITEVGMGLVVYPDMHRYEATIDSSSLTTATDFVYRWVAIDEAGNTNTTVDRPITVSNRAPNITTNTTYVGLAGKEFIEIVDFSDEDTSQNNASFFSCSDNSAQFDTTTLSHNKCMINWSNPTNGNYAFTLTVYDRKNGVNLLSDTTPVTVDVQTSISQNVSVDANTDLVVSYFLGAQLITAETSYGSNDIVALLADSNGYDITINAIDEVKINVINASVASDASILTRKLNVAYVENATADIGEEYRFVPYAAYTIEVDYTTNESYEILFPYENYSILYEDQIQIIKLPYNTTSNTIDYSNITTLSTSVNNTTQVATAETDNFSVFILVENKDYDGDGYLFNDTLECNDFDANVNPAQDELCGNSIDDNCNGQVDESCGGGGGSPPKGGGGSSSYIAPDPTCDDGEQNGAETGVDCGGTCDVCLEEIEYSREPSSCYDAVQDFDEEGIDCGGSCNAICIVEEEIVEDIIAPEPSCYDGVQNGFEEGVDCGGDCVSCRPIVKEPIIEKPAQPEKKKSNGILFILIGLLIAGGVVAFVMKSQSMDLFGNKTQHAVAGKISLSSASDIADDDIANIARYVEEQQENSYHDRDIKNHLINYGYSKENIEGAMDALVQKEYLATVGEYLGKYQSQGFSEEELQAWLIEKGINPSVIAIAMDRHRRKQQQDFSF